MFEMDRHKNACAFARTETIKQFGKDSVPCTLGSPAHRYWLEKYDEYKASN